MAIRVNRPGLYGLTILASITGLGLGAYQGAFNPKDILQKYENMRTGNIHHTDNPIPPYKTKSNGWKVVRPNQFQAAGIGGNGEVSSDGGGVARCGYGWTEKGGKEVCTDYRGGLSEKVITEDHPEGIPIHDPEASGELTFAWE